MSVSWNGDALKKKYIDAAKRGLDKTMAECVVQFKGNHPGWNNITGTAEGSVGIVQFAREQGPMVVGIWGSKDVDYMIWLEIKHWSALRSAADRIYPNLTQNIKDALTKI